MHPGVEWISWLSFARYSYTALIVNEYQGRDIPCATDDVSISIGAESGQCPLPGEEVIASFIHVAQLMQTIRKMNLMKNRQSRASNGGGMGTRWAMCFEDKMDSPCGIVTSLMVPGHIPANL